MHDAATLQVDGGLVCRDSLTINRGNLAISPSIGRRIPVVRVRIGQCTTAIEVVLYKAAIHVYGHATSGKTGLTTSID